MDPKQALLRYIWPDETGPAKSVAVYFEQGM